MSLATRAAAAGRGRRTPFVLCYHGIGVERPADDPYGLMISADAFAEHLDVLIARGYRLVTVDELWTAIQAGGTAADGLAAITFDDGLADTMHTAAALLAERGATATAFLAPALLGGDHPDLPPGRRILRADEVPALEASGIAIGAHSSDHVDLAKLDAGAALEQLRASRATLEAILGHPVKTMAYPFGSYGAPTLAAARKAGFEVACACSGAGPWRALELPREPVFPSTGPWRLRLKAAGLYQPIQAAGRWHARLRGTTGGTPA